MPPALTTAPNSATPSAAGFMLRSPKGRVLLLKRNGKGDSAGTWGWPGGHIEDGESSLIAAGRELAEETGVVRPCNLDEVRLIHIGDTPDNKGKFYTYLAPVSREFEPTLNDEHSEYKWADFDALPEPLHPGVKATLATDPPTSESQRRAMWASASGHSTLGIPASVGREFSEADPGGKLPEKKGDGATDMSGKNFEDLFGLLKKFFTEEAQESEHQLDGLDGIVEKHAEVMSEVQKRLGGASTDVLKQVLSKAKAEGKRSAIEWIEKELAKRGAHDAAITDLLGQSDEGVKEANAPGTCQEDPRIRLLETIGDVKVYLVKGPVVERDWYMDFVQASNDLEAPEWMPPNEIWIDEAELANKDRFLLHEIVERNLMMALGWSYDKAHDHANCVEHEALADPKLLPDYLAQAKADLLRIQESAKPTQAEAKYEPVALGKDHCVACRHFAAPDRCDRIQGQVDAGGWCKYFETKVVSQDAVREDPDIGPFKERVREIRRYRRLGLSDPKLGRIPTGADLSRAESEVNKRTHIDVKSLQPKAHDSKVLAQDRYDARGKRIIANDIFALDKTGSVRTYDNDGQLHISRTPISKSNICEYYGHEIPDGDKLGLDPQKKYKLLRHPDELKKAAASSNGKQLMIEHIPVSADDPQKDEWVGGTGTDAEFDYPYLYNSLHVHDRKGIDGIESGKQRELSAAYRYRPDMTPGTFHGEPFDGVMRDIDFNHVCLVPEGRVGSDVMVLDEALKDKSMFDFNKFKPMFNFGKFAKDAKDAHYTKDQQALMRRFWESGKQAHAKGVPLDADNRVVGGGPPNKNSPVRQAWEAGWKGESIDWWFAKDAGEHPEITNRAGFRKGDKDKNILGAAIRSQQGKDAPSVKVGDRVEVGGNVGKVIQLDKGGLGKVLVEYGPNNKVWEKVSQVRLA